MLMRKTVKFGGSSLADAEHVQKVVDIIKADPSRLYVIPSAPGRRFKGDVKVTDMLFVCLRSPFAETMRQWSAVRLILNTKAAFGRMTV